MLPPSISTDDNEDRPDASTVVKRAVLGLVTPICVASMLPPLMSTVAIVAVPETSKLLENVADVPVIPPVVSVPESVVLPVTPRVPATVALSSTSSVSMCAVPSRYKSRNSLVAVPKSRRFVADGTKDVAISELTYRTSVFASPIVVLPFSVVTPSTSRFVSIWTLPPTVRSTATVALSSTSNVSICAVPSRNRLRNSLAASPKSLASSELGTMFVETCALTATVSVFALPIVVLPFSVVLPVTVVLLSTVRSPPTSNAPVTSTLFANELAAVTVIEPPIVASPAISKSAKRLPTAPRSTTPSPDGRILFAVFVAASSYHAAAEAVSDTQTYIRFVVVFSHREPFA